MYRADLQHIADVKQSWAWAPVFSDVRQVRVELSRDLDTVISGHNCVILARTSFDIFPQLEFFNFV
jgi:hypothetical protein